MKTPRYRRWWRVTLAILLAIAACFLGWKYFSQSWAEARLAEELARLDQADPHWRLEDWNQRFPPVPAEKNLTRSVFQLQSLVFHFKEGREIPDYDGIFSNSELHPAKLLNSVQVADLHIALEKCQALPGEMEALLQQHPSSLPPPDWNDKSFHILSFIRNEPQALRHIATMMDCQSELWLQDNNPSQSIRAIETMLHCSHALEQEAGLVYPLVMMAMQSRAVLRVQRLLALTNPAAADLERLQARLLAEAEAPVYRHAVLGERAYIDRYRSLSS